MTPVNRGIVVSAIWSLVTTIPLNAESPSRIQRYSIASWTEQDGLSSPFINAITQDLAGYLWLGTNAGLVRFDGVRFVRWESITTPQLPSAGVGALAVGPDGSLWIGLLGNGGVTRLRGRELTSYQGDGGLPEGGVTELVTDHEGSIWAGTRRGLSRFRQNRWERIGPLQGLPEPAVADIYEDGQHHLWVASSAGVFRKMPGTDTLQLVSAPADIDALGEDGAGVVWVSTIRSTLEPLLRSQAKPAATPVSLTARGSRVLLDRVGHVWVATVGAGVLRLGVENGSQNRVVERLTEEDGLASNAVRALWEDREGNVWVGTQNGLNRLSESVVTSIPGRRETFGGQPVHAVAATPDNRMWVGTNKGLYRFSDTTGSPRRFDEGDGLAGMEVGALHVDGRGNLWVATDQGISRFANERFVRVDVPRRTNWTRTYAITTDPTGSAWFSSRWGGLFRWADGALAGFESNQDIAHRVGLSTLTDTSGRIWIGFTDGSIARHENGRFTAYAQKDTFGTDRAAAIYEDESHNIWVGANGSLSQFQNGRFLTVSSKDGFPSDNVTAILGDDEGLLWLGVGSGLLRLNKDEFNRATADPSHRIQYALYDVSDGLLGTPTSLGYPMTSPRF
jgi:ligand-binding sensor domain-containing protein